MEISEAAPIIVVFLLAAHVIALVYWIYRDDTKLLTANDVASIVTGGYWIVVRLLLCPIFCCCCYVSLQRMAVPTFKCKIQDLT
ncbi:hypothetical protein FCM35_KLT17436 [Carex littledalei]|uniref:Uncharacterized protein n=1 Tax=Carex littledalei TaxID=544730 RepID=A0A833RRH2_9POAL|nr:hypothetical protein FCM35_KLT17436 [Carex littledalei]